MKKLKMIDLFSGGGMFSYAEKLVGGIETIQFCEIDSYCKKVLKKHWPLVPIHDDIRTYKPEPYSADIVVGGFPCQDLSCSGKRLGITKETRSGLFYELMRVVCVVRPKYVIMENVARSLITDWELFSESFPRQGLMQNGELFEQAIMSEPPTTEIDGFALQLTETLPTPTAMDIREDGLKHATKMLRGKLTIIRPTNTGDFERQSNDESNQGQSRVDENLSGSSNTGKAISPKSGGVCELSKKTSNDQGTSAKTNIRKTKIEHWFRKDKAGFSYPSIEDWEVIKPHLIEIQFDKEMTTVKTKEWTSKSPILPTPTASDIEEGQPKMFSSRTAAFTGRTRKGKGGE